jgi:glyoxylase-like metal-dependent hydrolase (beta-lactamase superfamily II)
LIKTDQKNILIDPGHAAYFDPVQEGLDNLNLSMNNIDLIICTHAHPDHIEAVQLFADAPTLFAIHSHEWQMVLDMAPQLKQMMGAELDHLTPDFFLNEGQLRVGDIDLEIHHTPGHSPGGICLYYASDKALLSGDLIFKDGLGRTDLPGGKSNLLKDSIRRMSVLDSAWLLSGHGDIVSGEDAVKSNFEQVESMWFGYL